ncbi:MAG: HD domain-containing protein [Syntrophomonadaceae bacterium]
MKRVELLLKDRLYNEYINRNVSAETQNKFCRHDLPHHIDVARITYILVLEHNDLNYFVKESNLGGKLAAKEVIYTAGLMHDIGKWQEYKIGMDHALLGSRLVREILPRASFNANEIEQISRAVYEHRNISRDMSFLGERLHRADNLSRVCSQCDLQDKCPKVKNKEIGLTGLEY